MSNHDETPVTESDDFEPEELEADLDDIGDVFPDGGEVHTPPSEADAPAPG